MQRAIVVVAFAAGLAGGFASRYVIPASVFAQARTQPPAPAHDTVRGQSFVLTDAQGNSIATFRPVQSFPGEVWTGTGPVVVLQENKTGKVIWRAPGGDELRIQPLNQR